MKQLRKSQNGLFNLEEIAAGHFILRDVYGNSIKLSLHKLIELSDFLSKESESEQAAYQEFLDAEYREYQTIQTEWRNFATTGDPDISPEDYYRADRLSE